MSFKDVFIENSNTINELFGEPCALFVEFPYDDIANLLLPSINVIVDKSKQVKGEFNNVVGYQTAVKILKSDLEEPPKGSALLQLGTGEVYTLGAMIEQTKTAWWLDAAISYDEFPDHL
ncbi:MAG: hypothetical protein IZT57_00755 [Chloroflexi bacterium]|nr:hypothetical protein [Chloroflexota bacterium]